MRARTTDHDASAIGGHDLSASCTTDGSGVSGTPDVPDAADAVAATAARARRTLVPLLFVYLLGTVCLQAFNLVFQRIGTDLGATDQASLITAIPGVVLGIACFIYGSLCDFLALKRLAVFGIMLLCAGSVAGFLFHGGLVAVIACRIVQTIGFQAAGSVYLVIVARYLHAGEKLLYFGMFTAAYQLATAIGVLSGGLVESVDWSLLFLIPLLSLAVLPVLVRDLPGASVASGASGASGASDGGRKDGGVDVPGFTLFGAAVLLLTLFFSMTRWWMVAASALLFAAFALYISRARNPFITADFFRNRRWLRSVTLIVVFYFINFSITPLVNDFAGDVYGMSGSQVSFMLLPALLIATVSGVCSGRVSRLLGRERAILLGGTLMCLGMLGCALGLGLGLDGFAGGVGGVGFSGGAASGAFGGVGGLGFGPVAVGASMCLFYGGMAMLYAPTVDTVLGTLSEEQSGRGVGLNDLAMQGAGAIGIAVFGTPIATRPFDSWSATGLTGVAANASNLFLIYAAIMLFGVLWFLLFRRSIRGETTEP